MPTRQVPQTPVSHDASSSGTCSRTASSRLCSAPTDTVVPVRASSAVNGFPGLTHTGPLDEVYLATVVDDIVLPLLRPPGDSARVRELEAALADAHLELRRRA